MPPPPVFVPEVVQMVPDDDEEIEDEWLDADAQTEGDATASALQITAQVCEPRKITERGIRPRAVVPTLCAADPSLYCARLCAPHARHDDLALMGQVWPDDCSTKRKLRDKAIWCARHLVQCLASHLHPGPKLPAHPCHSHPRHAEDGRDTRGATEAEVTKAVSAGGRVVGRVPAAGTMVRAWAARSHKRVIKDTSQSWG